MDNRFDAVIVGGGPAGALAAQRLAWLGWRVALVERGARHRNKTCGHCLNPRAFAALDRVGLLNDVRAIAEGSTQRLRIHDYGDLVLESSLIGNDCQTGLVVARDRLDQLLIDSAAAAGAHVFQGKSARMVSRDDEDSRIEVIGEQSRWSCRTRLVIGADGVGTAVARAAGLCVKSNHGRKYGFSFDLACDDSGAIQDAAIEMFIVPGGYVGIVKQGGESVHVAGLISDKLPRELRDPLSFVRLAALRHPRLQHIGLHQIRRNTIDRFSAVGPMPWRPRAIANQWAALVGDAAGYIEPFTGEGMTWAMQSAHALGDVLADAKPGAWSSELGRAYARAWKHQIGQKQIMCRMIAGTLARSRMTNWLLRAGVAYPALTRRVVERVVAA